MSILNRLEEGQVVKSLPVKGSSLAIIRQMAKVVLEDEKHRTMVLTSDNGQTEIVRAVANDDNVDIVMSTAKFLALMKSQRRIVRVQDDDDDDID